MSLVKGRVMVFVLTVCNAGEAYSYTGGCASYETRSVIACFGKIKDAREFMSELIDLRQYTDVLAGKWAEGSKIMGVEVKYSWVSFVKSYDILKLPLM